MEEGNHNEKGNGTKEVEYKPLPGGPSNYGTQNATKKSELEIVQEGS